MSLSSSNRRGEKTTNKKWYIACYLYFHISSLYVVFFMPLLVDIPIKNIVSNMKSPFGIYKITKFMCMLNVSRFVRVRTCYFALNKS